MTAERPFLILKAGSLKSLSDFVERFGDTEDTFLSSSGLRPKQVRIIDIEAAEPLPADLNDYAGAIISGSASMVSSQAPWMQKAEAWLRGAVASGLPVLGVCFGHQLLSHALGGSVGPNAEGLEGGTVDINFRADGDPLFGGIGPQVALQAHHYETVLVPPQGAQILASSPHDRHQALRHAMNAWSVQFHPELTMPMMHVLMDALSTGSDPHGHAQMRDTLRPSPEGPLLLRRFVSLARAYTK
ncbi:glutamine amidotransferase [Mesorhizobium sp. GR13]|uniref:glutamine amidotransferase n=1 Tax=Mesorhizobium sp. GR13 TaxID=2562308 RepID=UPI0010C0B067|nr:glutamine amidotransferase [Mesorhizobium sp. GR13]